MPAILFGSISSLADTSEMQRDAFNRAFAAHDLSWTWDRDTYLAMLEGNGGEARIAAYAADRGDSVDAGEVHRTKSKLFQEALAGAHLEARPGVTDTISAAKAAGWKVGFVTTTSRQNVTALLDALSPAVSAGDFDLVTDLTTVDQPKPDAAVYTYAAATLEVPASDCVAVEDNVGGVAAARAAGMACIATPNANTAGHDFSAASTTEDAVDFATARGLVA